MATIYDKDNNGFQHISVPFNYNRGNPVPLDNSSVWLTFDAAKTYATTNPTAYDGQILAVKEGEQFAVYVIDSSIAESSLRKLAAGGTADELASRLTVAEGKLVGIDTTVSAYVDEQVTTAVANVISGAPEAFDTLKEIADWIAEDETGTEALVARVTANEGNIATLSNTTIPGLTATYLKQTDFASISAATGLDRANSTNKVVVNTDLTSAIDTAKTEAATDATSKVEALSAELKGDITQLNNDLTGAIDIAKTEAIAAAETDAAAKVEGLSVELKDDIAELNNTLTANITDVAATVNTLSGTTVPGIAATVNTLSTTTIPNLETSLTGKIASVSADTLAKANTYATDIVKALSNDTGLSAASPTNKIVTHTELTAAVANLAGAMHFEGVKNAVPTDNTGYESGDVILVGTKEYIFDGTNWVELGDEGLYVTNAKHTADVGALSTAIDNKIKIDDLSAATLNVKHIEGDAYHQLVVNNQVDSNTLYIVSSDNLNAYGEKITNVATPTDATDAATKGYVDSLSVSQLAWDITVIDCGTAVN